MTAIGTALAAVFAEHSYRHAGDIMIRCLWASLIRLMLILALAILAYDAVVIGLAYPPFGVGALIGASWLKTRRR